MNNIEIRSLGDWKKLPVSFAEETGINIYCDGITINGNRERCGHWYGSHDAGCAAERIAAMITQNT